MAIKKILVPVTGKLDQTNTLDLAVAVGRTLHSRIDVVYMEIDPDRVGETGYEDKTAGLIYAHRAILPELVKATRDAARAEFHAWAERSGIELMLSKASPAQNSFVHWKECVGPPESIIADLGRFCDLIVISRADGTDNERHMPQLEAALFEAVRPVLLTPAEGSKQLRQNVLVGWNASPGAFRALTAAIPLLSCMHLVVLLTIGEKRAGRTCTRQRATRLSGRSWREIGKDDCDSGSARCRRASFAGGDNRQRWYPRHRGL